MESGNLVPSGDLWPRFLYRNYEYNPHDPWDGLLRSGLLVKVGLFVYSLSRLYFHLTESQAFKHVFTSPSSVLNSASKATRSSNARIHGMTMVTTASLAYIATQVWTVLPGTETLL